MGLGFKSFLPKLDSAYSLRKSAIFINEDKDQSFSEHGFSSPALSLIGVVFAERKSPWRELRISVFFPSSFCGGMLRCFRILQTHKRRAHSGFFFDFATNPKWIVLRLFLIFQIDNYEH